MAPDRSSELHLHFVEVDQVASGLAGSEPPLAEARTQLGSAELHRSSGPPRGRSAPLLTRRRLVFFEYTLVAGVNDRVEDARRLAPLLRGIPAKLNVIPMNRHADSRLGPPDDATVDRFVAEVAASGLRVTLRRSRGPDIDAACGQLALRPGPRRDRGGARAGGGRRAGRADPARLEASRGGRWEPGSPHALRSRRHPRRRRSSYMNWSGQRTCPSSGCSKRHAA